jgi:hypothetical protein
MRRKEGRKGGEGKDEGEKKKEVVVMEEGTEEEKHE